MLIVFFEREDVDRRQFCRCIIGVSGVPRGPYCMCKTKMAACALRIMCCVLESCCSFDGSFSSRSTITRFCSLFVGPHNVHHWVTSNCATHLNCHFSFFLTNEYESSIIN